MKEFEAGLFAVICDVSIDTLESSGFSTYQIAADYISNMINRGQASLMLNFITPIYDVVNRIYCLDMGEMVLYINRYFSERQFDKYYRPIKDVKDCFGQYVKINLTLPS